MLDAIERIQQFTASMSKDAFIADERTPPMQPLLVAALAKLNEKETED